MESIPTSVLKKEYNELLSLRRLRQSQGADLADSNKKILDALYNELLSREIVCPNILD